MNHIEMDEFKSFEGAISKRITYQSLPYLAKDYFFTIFEGKAETNGLAFHRVVLFIEGREGEGFFYLYDEYLQCFEIIGFFKCHNPEPNDVEWTESYNSNFEELSKRCLVPVEAFTQIISSNEQLLNEREELEVKSEPKKKPIKAFAQELRINQVDNGYVLTIVDKATQIAEQTRVFEDWKECAQFTSDWSSGSVETA